MGEPYRCDRTLSRTRACDVRTRPTCAACDDGRMSTAGVGAAAHPFSHDGEPGDARAEVGVVLCHGFTGSPASMRPWADALAAAGHTVRLPLLPGHGTRWQDLNATTFDDWLSAITAAVEELHGRCRAVVVAGLSMGGTLALRVAELHGDRIAGLVLVNPSVMTTRIDAKFGWLLRALLPVVLTVLPSLPGIADDIRKPGIVEGGYDRLPVAAGLSLQAAWKVVRRDLPRVTVPLLLLHSAVDHVVEPENAAIVLAEVSSKDVREVLLDNSYHVATLDHDAPLIEQASLAFIERVAAP